MPFWASKIAVGFDGGGTKTERIVLDAEGNTIGQGAAGPSNPLRVGFDAAFKGLSEAAARARGKPGNSGWRNRFLTRRQLQT